MKTGWFAWALLGAALSPGCEDDIAFRVSGQDAGPVEDGSAPPSQSDGGTTPSDAVAAPDPDDAGPADDTGDSDAADVRDGGPDPGLARCGGFIGPCVRADEFCDFIRDSCGVADESGVCRPRPMACSTEYAPVCACDGRVYGNTCKASFAGLDVSNTQICSAPQGFFRCGHRFCDRIETYCRHTVSTNHEQPDTFLCPSLPAACVGNATCGCLMTEPCADQCVEVLGGGVILQCLGRVHLQPGPSSRFEAFQFATFVPARHAAAVAMMGPEGLEPSTLGLKIPCSTR